MGRKAMSGKEDKPPLYGRMMQSIHTRHELGNRMRMLKLPLIFSEPRLYADAISQFYLLSRTLELRLQSAHHPMVERVKALGLHVTPGYEADLCSLYGSAWRDKAEAAATHATKQYIKELNAADDVSLVAAAFILYGALVVGGGKATQAKVKKIFPSCEHALFDVAEDMASIRREFKGGFTAIGREWPEHFHTLEKEAARFMALNNTVVFAIRCWGRRASCVALTAAFMVAACCVMWRRARPL